jgi:hypothetical protein
LQGRKSDGTTVAIAKLHRALITQKLAGMLLECPRQLEKIANLVGIFAHGE